ncbi:CatB-related O-acetyltransferase [Roseibacterium sp. SDUM158017]|uniref:CatB-related O-acetyltransferase n=1 Tax=Roseicyclus salinarum TaxID=3036773 RepID=UPI0024151FA9|nr:CatB-related O-acetyltransferase [Roseibacterium sp. SDUM158017]MDG4650323.1 CatB-related O-acetyltransferase [Roseibacterium sp. SDUM158017]
MHAPFSTPDTLHPVRLPDGGVHKGTVFLRPAIDHPRIEVGDYSYASAHVPPDDWAAHLAPWLYPFSPERLIIGRFCQFADGVKFVTASANHRHDGFSSFPFMIFGGDGVLDRPSMPGPGADTVVGHDVWIGTGASILPGARIGSGTIVAAGAVVTGEVAPYSLVGGNPARVIRPRFPARIVARLLELEWWHWPIDRILAHEAAICGGDIEALEAAAP